MSLKVPPHFFKTLDCDEIRGLLCGNVKKEPVTEFIDCKHLINSLNWKKKRRKKYDNQETKASPGRADAKVQICLPNTDLV